MARAAQLRSIRILEVRIDDVTQSEAIAQIAGFVAAGGPHQIVTINPEFVVAARRNSAFARVLAAADLATPDGFGLMLVAQMRGTPLRERVTGVVLVQRLAEAAAHRGWRIFLLGAAPSVAERAAAQLQSTYPGLQIAGCYSGSPKPEDEPSIQARIQSAKPDILLVAYGHPRQDLWIARNQPVLKVPIAIGVGGTFDYLAGIVPLAPIWMRQLGLEWLFRLIQQPQRWRRIMDAVPIFLWHTLWERQNRPGDNETTR
jgi:N-acetylglucosaminyldiphosphoundecaprenol N-acetyl-beta-D-mannosaminyltransferase